MSLRVENILLCREEIETSLHSGERLEIADDLLSIEIIINRLREEGRIQEKEKTILYGVALFSWSKIAELLGYANGYVIKGKFRHLCRMIGNRMGEEYKDRTLFSNLTETQFKKAKKYQRLLIRSGWASKISNNEEKKGLSNA